MSHHISYTLNTQKTVQNLSMLPIHQRHSTDPPRVVHGSDGPAGRVGSGRVGPGRAGSGHDFAGFWRVGSLSTGQHFGCFSFLLIISWYLNRVAHYESSNTTLGLIDFIRYVIYIIIIEAQRRQWPHKESTFFGQYSVFIRAELAVPKRRQTPGWSDCATLG